MSDPGDWSLVAATCLTLGLGLGAGAEWARRRGRRREADRAAAALGTWFADNRGADKNAVAAWFVGRWRGAADPPPVPILRLEYHAAREGKEAVRVRLLFATGDVERVARVTIEERLVWHELPEPVREALMRSTEPEVILQLWPDAAEATK